jgi:hypothetical protein
MSVSGGAGSPFPAYVDAGRGGAAIPEPGTVEVTATVDVVYGIGEDGRGKLRTGNGAGQPS